MTVKELYEWAKEKKVEDKEIKIGECDNQGLCGSCDLIPVVFYQYEENDEPTTVTLYKEHDYYDYYDYLD